VDPPTPVAETGLPSCPEGIRGGTGAREHRQRSPRIHARTDRPICCCISSEAAARVPPGHRATRWVLRRPSAPTPPATRLQGRDFAMHTQQAARDSPAKRPRLHSWGGRRGGRSEATDSQSGPRARHSREAWRAARASAPAQPRPRTKNHMFPTPYAISRYLSQ
jgi:hypothetical protein